MSKNEIHKGQVLKDKLKEKNILQEDIADILEIDRATLFRWLKNENLSKHKIRQIGMAANLDLEELFPSMFKANELGMNQNPGTNWKQKYYDLLEKQNEMQERIIVLQEEVATYQKKEIDNGTNSEQ
ncbi:MAG: hypothetical protein N4A41_14990 [Crocinitomicaceae bacterium]|jgi:transcriptional regulator with XRE-family HTH domain|nr:hypothetical protein [Crocinitomicaceae bacterium]